MVLVLPVPLLASGNPDSKLTQNLRHARQPQLTATLSPHRSEQHLPLWIHAPASARAGGHAMRQTPEMAQVSEGRESSQEAVEPPERKVPRRSGAEAVYQEQHALFDKRLTLETGFSYARFDRKAINLSGFLVLDAIFLGTISVDNVESDILTFDIQARWGLSERLQVDLAAPFLYRRTTFQSGGVGGDATAQSEEDVTLRPEFQVGDISAGLYYQLRRETATSPDIVANVRIKAPTGTDPYGVKLVTDPNNSNLRFPEELPSGNGVWSLSTGLSFIKTIDPAILFADASLFYNFSERFSDISSTAGTKIPGEVMLGNSLQYGLGMAFALSERMSMTFSYSQRFTEKTRIKQSGGSSTSIIGSDANIAVLNIGVTSALSDRRSMITNLGVGLTSDAADVQFTMKFPYSFR